MLSMLGKKNRERLSPFNRQSVCVCVCERERESEREREREVTEWK